MAKLARHIYPLSSKTLLRQFEKAVQKQYGYLVIDGKATMPEHERLETGLFDRGEKRRLDVDLNNGAKLFRLFRLDDVTNKMENTDTFSEYPRPSGIPTGQGNEDQMEYEDDENSGIMKHF